MKDNGFTKFYVRFAALVLALVAFGFAGVGIALAMDRSGLFRSEPMIVVGAFVMIGSFLALGYVGVQVIMRIREA